MGEVRVVVEERTTRWIQMMTPTWLLLLKLMFPGIPTASGKRHRGRKIPLIPR